MFAHRQDPRDDCRLCPFHTKHICQFLEVDGRRFTNRKDGIAQPVHAQCAELVVEKVDTELGRKEWNVLDDGLSDSPLFVFCELDNGREECL